jgi:hypothetical protein
MAHYERSIYEDRRFDPPEDGGVEWTKLAEMDPVAKRWT